MKRKITLLRLTIIIAVLASVGIAMAVIPPPPADQTIGIYDTVYDGFDTPGCRGCHDSGVPDTHHMLVEEGIKECLDCHTLFPVEAPRDCLECHVASPHHVTDAAEARDCSYCHGSFVDDFDDEHYIPTYDVSLVTPDTKYRVIDEDGKKWGGCEACHEPDASMTPAINANHDTHHTAINCSTFGNICHFDPKTDIRKCEDCHGVNSIHNIQYDYDNTKGKLGYGHIGDNWDCMGCHAWYEPYKGGLPIDPVIVPFMASITPSSLVTGEETVVTIEGDNFVSTVEGTTYTSEVVVETSEGDTITLEPDTITTTEITVTIPARDTGSYGVYLIKAELRSNLRSVVVAPDVRIDSVEVDKSGTSLTINGIGFSDTDPSALHRSLGLKVNPNDLKVKKIPAKVTVYDWTDNKIRVSCSEPLGPKATVTVITEYDKDTATIAGGT